MTIYVKTNDNSQQLIELMFIILTDNLINRYDKMNTCPILYVYI